MVDMNIDHFLRTSSDSDQIGGNLNSDVQIATTPVSWADPAEEELMEQMFSQRPSHSVKGPSTSGPVLALGRGRGRGRIGIVNCKLGRVGFRPDPAM